ncbi:MAG: hypothetical protein AAF756_16940 [Pseudomonadota bacterium]
MSAKAINGFIRCLALLRPVYIYTLFLMLLGATAEACPNPPAMIVAGDPGAILERSDAGFYGELIDLKIGDNDEQIATFQVLENFKGPETSIHIVKNRHFSSCSRPLSERESRYYVFASFNESGELAIGRMATFVSKSLADSSGMVLPSRDSE